MSKKELLTIPLLKTVKGEKKEVLVAEVFELPRSGRILVADYYCGKKLRARFFTDGVNYKSVYQWPAEHWHESHPQDYCHSYESTPKTDALVFSFLKEKNRGNAFWQIYYFVQDKNYERRQKMWDSRWERMKEHFAMFPDLPADLEEYCENHIFNSSYVFFTKLDKNGRRQGRCGHCGKSFRVKRDTKHNTEGVCPRCGCQVTYKGDWYKSAITDVQKLAVCHKVDGQLLIRWTEVVRSFCYPEYKRGYRFEDTYRNLHLKAKSGQRLYGYAYKKAPYAYDKDWHIQNDTPCTADSFVYTTNLHEVFGERFYNVDLMELQSLQKPICFHWLLNNLRDIPAAEYMFKAGMFNLAQDAHRLDLPVGGKFSFQSCLGVNGQYAKLYAKLDVTVTEHLIIKASSQMVTEENVVALRGLIDTIYSAEEITEMYRYMTLQKFITYFGKQRQIYPKERLERLRRWYKDYINMATELNVDLSHKGVRFPKEIKEAHDLILQRLYKVKMANEDGAFAKAVAKIYQNLPFTSFEKDGYCIRLPEGESDFVIEGTSLSHCVGGEQYRKNHLAGTNLIYFIRRTENPNKPYFTMELDMKALKIRQLYGYGDCAAPKKVWAFAKAVVAAMQKNTRRKLA